MLLVPHTSFAWVQCFKVWGVRLPGRNVPSRGDGVSDTTFLFFIYFFLAEFKQFLDEVMQPAEIRKSPSPKHPSLFWAFLRARNCL